MAYLPFACVSHHLQFASLSWPNIQFPTCMTEVFAKTALTAICFMLLMNLIDLNKERRKGFCIDGEFNVYISNYMKLQKKIHS